MNVSDHQGIETLLDIVGLSLGDRHFDARYNVAPTANVLCIGDSVSLSGANAGSATGELIEMHWGIVPSWAKSGSFKGPIINARSESIHDKPTFKKAVATSRVVVPANGFYEWRREGKAREAWYLCPEDAPGFFFAGICQVSGDGEPQVALMTCSANDAMSDIHHRMPVILDGGSVSAWLDHAATTTDDVNALVAASQATGFKKTPVTSYVNNARNDGPKCVKPA